MMHNAVLYAFTVLFVCSIVMAENPRGPGSGRSPFDDETWIAFSKDGLTFTGHRCIFEHASVPDILVLSPGKFLVYFVDFSRPSEKTESISVGVSEDFGKTFRKEKVQIEGLSAHKAVDPDAVLLPDGRIRLFYFACSPPAGGRPSDPARQEGPHQVRSAISSDGIRFKEEPDICFSREGLTDPDVVRLKEGKWRMYFPVHAGDPKASVLSATSADGVIFTEDPGVRHPSPAIPGSLLLADGRVRLFVNGPGGILSMLSQDGLSFREEAGHRVRSEGGRGLADPSPARLEDGTYLLVYKKMPGGQRMGPPGQPMPGLPPPRPR